MLAWLDERILALFTKFSHGFTRLTGLTNFFLYRVCLGLEAISLMSAIANRWVHLLSTDFPLPLLLVYAVMISWIPVQIEMSHRADKQIFRDPLVKPAIQEEQLKGVFSSMRLLMLGMSAVMLLEVWFLPMLSKVGKLADVNFALFPFYFSAASYFAAVPPSGPAKSKVSEWLGGLQRGFRKLVPARSTG